MDEQQINENKTLSGDDITCPSCGSHNVRCRLSLRRKAAQHVFTARTATTPAKAL